MSDKAKEKKKKAIGKRPKNKKDEVEIPDHHKLREKSKD